MRIALDAMGGDHAPLQTVLGAVQAAKEYGIETTLVGVGDDIRPLLQRESSAVGLRDGMIDIVHASEVIGMGEHPATAVRRKKDSSLVVAATLVKEGRCSAMVSAGNTGAAMAASLFAYGRIKGVERPAIASPMPTAHGFCLILDAGANVDLKAKHLLQFAHMGSIYMRGVQGIERPRVGLLNVGEEEAKGNELCLEAHPLLKSSGLDFVGNIEGRDIPRHKADIVICDGFVGNVVLKFAEGLGMTLFDLLRAEIMKGTLSRLGAILVKPALRSVKKLMDYSEYGGAPLLGLNGVTIISHGSSNAKAIKNALRAGVRAAESGVVAAISGSIASMEEGNGNE